MSRNRLSYPRSPSTLFRVQQGLSRARALMDTFYDRPLDLSQISQQASFSQYHFIRPCPRR